MGHQSVSPLLWPVESISWDNQPVVLAVATVEGAPRERTRLQVRRVAREVLGRLFAIPPERVMLQSKPGLPPQLAGPLPEMGLSFAHESGFSLIAIRLDGPVGVDLMHCHQVPDDWSLLARDYLGPSIATQLGVLPPDDGKFAFAQFWVALEARLKCLGLPLAEWKIETADRLNTCMVVPVQLPQGWLGALAWL